MHGDTLQPCGECPWSPLGGDLNVFHLAAGWKNGQTVGMKPLQMEFNGVADYRFGFLDRLTGGDTPPLPTINACSSHCVAIIRVITCLQ